MNQTTTQPVAVPANVNSPATLLTDEQRIDALITRWFEINGQKVDKDDPTLPLLLLVDERLERAELQMQTQLQQLESVQWQHFLLEMDKRSQQLKKDLQVLEGAKEQFMAQLDRTNRENVFEFASETGEKIEKALFSIKVFGGVFVGMQLLTLVVFLFFAFKG